MGNQFVEATEKAIAKLVTAYQGNPNRYWNERDLHWYLFHCLKQDPVFLRDYGTELVRAEFPTRAVYTEEKTPARGHYDLVILDAVSATSVVLPKYRYLQANITGPEFSADQLWRKSFFPRFGELTKC